MTGGRQARRAARTCRHRQPAVQRGVAVLAEHQRKGQMTDKERDVMFGKIQFAPR